MNILEGSVQKANDQVRVNVQLINALTYAHLWADTYDRRSTDIFAVESEIAKSVADALQAKLTGPEKSSIVKAPTADPKRTNFISRADFFGTSGPAPICARRLNISIKRSPKTRITHWPMPGWPIRICCFRTTGAHRPRNRSLQRELR